MKSVWMNHRKRTKNSIEEKTGIPRFLFIQTARSHKIKRGQSAFQRPRSGFDVGVVRQCTKQEADGMISVVSLYVSKNCE